MSTPKTGKHVRLRDTGAFPAKHITRDRPYLTAGQSYLVVSVSKWSGEKRRVFIEVPGRDEWECMWSGQVSALPRCSVCDSEHHKTPKLDKNGDPFPCPQDGAATP